MTDRPAPTTLGRPTPPATAADRREFLEAGLRPVACLSCGLEVLVKKNSLAHTSIQWTSASAACPELAAAGPATEEGCGKLRESIASAVRDGLLEVPREDSD